MIARSVKVNHQKRKHPVITRLMSLNLDLFNRNFEAIGLYGAWANEARLTSHPLRPGTFKLSTIAGPSGNRHNPLLYSKQAMQDSIVATIMVSTLFTVVLLKFRLIFHRLIACVYRLELMMKLLVLNLAMVILLLPGRH